MDSGELICTWNWKRQLTGRLNEELQNLKDKIKSIGSLNEGESKWVFKPSSKEVYSSKVIPSIIDDVILEGNSTEPEKLRNNLLPQKLGIFVWRAIKNRLLTRVELEKRDVTLESSSFPLCGSASETIEHALFLCNHAKSVWVGIFKWWDPNARCNFGADNFFRGTSITGTSKLSTKIWQAIEWVKGYFICQNKNAKVFSNDNWATPKIINEIQTKSSEWIKNRSNMVQMDWHQWLLHSSNLNFPRINNHDPG
ncbi:uncharacterized protein [Rutidosis leptorrhynchoides]|uniref:uncharacterized protein n=1 Tax=Rutidosis leptorrhynchoides TaxID=125765 RepID=UPI003A99990C